MTPGDAYCTSKSDTSERVVHTCTYYCTSRCSNIIVNTNTVSILYKHHFSSIQFRYVCVRNGVVCTLALLYVGDFPQLHTQVPGKKNLASVSCSWKTESRLGGGGEWGCCGGGKASPILISLLSAPAHTHTHAVFFPSSLLSQERGVGRGEEKGWCKQSKLRKGRRWTNQRWHLTK